MLNIPQSPTGFQTFPLNNFKYFLTLFSKFFSSFPHGTCSLSVSSRYLALGEIYHPFSAALPSYTTLRTPIVRTELRITNGILTLYDALFQRTYTRVRSDRASLCHNSPDRSLTIFSLSSSRFTRRYWGNRCYFLFLPLIICLNSGGSLASLEVLFKERI